MFDKNRHSVDKLLKLITAVKYMKEAQVTAAIWLPYHAQWGKMVLDEMF